MAGRAESEKTLEELDGQDWGEPTYDSYVVRTCHRLRRVPLRDFTAEDLGLMIGQDIGRSFLVPLALDRLAVDPFVAGDSHPGDLLASVVAVSSSHWAGVPELYARAVGIAERAMTWLADESRDQDPIAEPFVGEDLRRFLIVRLSAFIARAGAPR